jgi:hypothetical protein
MEILFFIKDIHTQLQEKKGEVPLWNSEWFCLILLQFIVILVNSSNHLSFLQDMHSLVSFEVALNSESIIVSVFCILSPVELRAEIQEFL